MKEFGGKDVLEVSHVACIAGRSGPKGKEREKERTGETGPTFKKYKCVWIHFRARGLLCLLVPLERKAQRWQTLQIKIPFSKHGLKISNNSCFSLTQEQF